MADGLATAEPCHCSAKWLSRGLAGRYAQQVPEGASEAPPVEVIVGAKAASQRLASMLHQRGKGVSLALRDFYPGWEASGCRAEGGKPLLLEHAANGDVLQLFFDDHILCADLLTLTPALTCSASSMITSCAHTHHTGTRPSNAIERHRCQRAYAAPTHTSRARVPHGRANDAHIVDVRRADAPSEPALPIGAVLDKHLIRAEPLHSIGEASYFMEVIAKAEATWRTATQRRRTLAAALLDRGRVLAAATAAGEEGGTKKGAYVPHAKTAAVENATDVNAADEDENA
jgi:hypothetical protein